MPRTAPDLRLVRAVAADIAGESADPSPEAVARIWSRVALVPDRTRSGRRLRWVVVPVGVAVAAVLLAMSVLLQSRPSLGPNIGAPSTQPSTEPSITFSPSPEPSVRVTTAGTIGAALPVGQVIDELVARSASVEPISLTDGQLLYVRIEAADVTPSGTVITRLNEQWLDPNGLRALKIILDGRDLSEPDPRDGSTFSPPPPGVPSLNEPNPQWLADLTTDPAELYDMFAAINAGGRLGGEAYVLKELAYLMLRSDPLLPPAQRAALFGVLGLIDGLTATELDVAGWRLYRLQQPDGPLSPVDLLVDPATGRVVGQRWSDIVTGTESIELLYFTVVNEVGATE